MLIGGDLCAYLSNQSNSILIQSGWDDVVFITTYGATYGANFTVNFELIFSNTPEPQI